MEAPIENTSTTETSSSLDHSASPVPGDVNYNITPQGITATLVPHVMDDTPDIRATPVPHVMDDTPDISATPVPHAMDDTPDISATSEGKINVPAPEGVRSRATPTPQDMTGTLTRQGMEATPILKPWRSTLMAKDKTITMTLTPKVDKDTSLSRSTAVTLSVSKDDPLSHTDESIMGNKNILCLTEQIESNPGRTNKHNQKIKVESSLTKGPGVSLTNNDQDVSVNAKDTSMSLTLTDQSVSVTPEDNRVSPTSRNMDRNSIDSLGSGGAIYVEIGQIQPHLSANSPQTSACRSLDDVDGPRVFSESPYSTVISEKPIPQSAKSREVEYARIQKRPKPKKGTSEAIMQSPDNANSIKIPVEQVIDRQEEDISVETSDNSRNSGIIRGSSGSSMTFENYQRVPGTMIPISTCLLQTVIPGEAIQTTSCNTVKNTPGKAVPVPPLRVSSKPPRPTSKLSLRDSQHRPSPRKNDSEVRTVRPIPHQTSPVLVLRSPVAMRPITSPISPDLGSRSAVAVNSGRHHQRTKSSDTNMTTNSPWQGQHFHGPVARAQSLQGQTYDASMLKTPSFEGHHCDKPVSRAHSYEGHHYYDGVGIRTPSFVEANQRSPQTRSVGSAGIYQKVGSVGRSRSSVTPRAINRHQQNMVSMTKTLEQSDQKQLLIKQDSMVGFRPYGTVSSTITRSLPKTENKDTGSNRQSVQSYQTSISVASVTESVKCGMKELVRILYIPFACCRRRKAEDHPKVAHRFRHYFFNRPRTCFVCKQKVLSQGSACQVCRYICHRQCENQVMTSCVPQVNHEVKHEAVKKYQYSPREPPASGSNTPGANMSSLRDMINRAQVEEDHLVLDLVYITERIISMSFPSDEHEVTYSYNLKEVMNMLRTKHDDNCLVINLSEPRQDLEKFNPKHVIDYGWPDYLAPPLERLCNICKAMDSWLSTDPRHVVVVHCKGSTSRIAVIIAAFMHYCSICASADQALDRFAMKRFYDDKLGGITLPSQIRYIEYFYGLLSGAIKINSNPLYLHHIVIHGVPNFDTQGGCRPFIKVYQGMQNIFTSGVYNVTDQMQKVCISISPGIPLRGDIMIKCYHKKAKTGQREVVWACQFHTCAISGYTLTFAKKDLDDARTDPRFPDGGKVEFVFGNSQDSNVRDVSEVTDFKSDVTVPVDDGSDALVRWDSYENFSHVKNADGTVNDVNENSVTSSSREGATRSIREQHSQGPVDGSLYATVTKRKHEHVETTSGSLFQNGTTSHDQQNGSHTSSVDSGISASSSGIAGNTSSNMNTTSTSVNITPQYTSNVNNNDSLHQSFSSTLNSSKSSYNNGVSSGQKKTVPPLDEQTQLDMILSDLLNDSVFVSTPQSPPKSGANSVSKDTRTFRTYDTQATPDGKTTYQTAEVTYKIPGGFKEERNYSMTKTEEKSYVPKNAFSYTSGPTSPELQRKDESPKTHSLPYRTDYDNRYYTNNESSFNRTMDSSRSMSPNEQTSSWLQEQQQKLRQRKDSKDDKTVQQERQLVEELKTAQNKYFMKRANNQAEEQATMETYRTASSPPPVANGPVSSSYVVTQNHAYSTDRSAHEPVRSFSPPGFTGDSFYNTSYTSTSTSSTQKPPPSPGQQRAQPPLTSPVIPPVRSSSKDFMQRSRNTSTSSWQGRIGQREPEQEVKPPIIRAISVTTPPQSPRPFSPVQQQQTYQVSKSRTSVEQQHPQRDQSLDIQMTLPVHAPTKTKVTEVQEFTHPEGQKKSHYITEVYVHRTAGADGTGTTQRSTTAEQKEKVERERNRLEELEKSLQAASNSIIATTPWQQQQQQQLQQQQQQKSYSTTERHVTRRVDTRKYETQQQQQHHQQQQSVSSYDGHGEVPPLSPTPHQRSTSPEWDNMNMHGSVTVEKRNNKDENLPRRSSEVNTLPRSNCNSLPRSEVSENSETSESEARMSFVEANTALNNLLGELTAWTKEKPDVTLNYNLDSWTVTADDVSATEKRDLKCIDHKQEMVEVSPNTLTVSKSRTDQRGDNSGPNSRRGGRDELDVQWGSCSRRSSRDELDCDRNKGSEDFLGGTRTLEELLWGSNSRRGSRDEIGSYDGSRRGSRDEIGSYDGSRRGSRDEIDSQDSSRRGSRDEIGSRDGSRRGSRDEVEVGQKVDFYIATSQQVQTPRSLVAKEVGPHIQEVLTDNEKDVPVPSFGFQSQTITDTTGVCPVTGATSAERQEQHVAMMHEEQPGMKITHSQQQEYTTATTHFQPEVTIHQKEATTNWSGQMTSESSCNRQTGQFVQETITQAEPVFMIEPGHKSGKHECTINVPGQGELSADQLGMLHTYLSEGGSSLKPVIEKSDRTATSTTAKSETVSKGQANRELTSNAAGLSVNQSCSKGGAETSQGLDWQTKRGTSEFEVDDNGHYAVVDKSQMFNTSSRQQFVTSQYQTIDSVRGSENTMATSQPARLASTTRMGQKQFITSEYQTIDSIESLDTQTLTQSKSQTEFTLSKSSKAADEVIYSQVIKKKSQVQAIAPPPPKQISVVEEDKISLRPIGPGVQTLEPEGMGTMGRSGATTPSFPVSPVASADLLYVDDSTPPFPVSPRTPYYNQAGSMTSPFNTMSSTTSSQHHTTQQHQQHMIQHQQLQHQQPQQMQQQQHQHQHHQQQQHQQQVIQQQQQQQQFQQQQHQQQQPQQQHSQHQQYQYQQEYHTGVRNQSGSVSSQDASHALHVDTSPRMVSPGGSMARTPTSPPSPSSLNTLRQQLSVGGTMSPTSHSMTGQSSPSLYFGTSRRGSISSLAESEPAHITTPRFVKDMSKYWYKPQITREDAIVLLKDKHPGSFVVRDSNSYPGAFGLALKVAHIPANVQTKSTGDPSADLVRHFLIEPTHKGVRLRGSNNEPIFGSLASLVYQHSNTPLSLPCKLMLPDAETMAMDGSSTMDSSSKSELPSSAAALLAQGAACNVLFLNTVDTESLTGPQAVARAMKVTFDTQPSPKTTVVHFKVSNQGITLTDNQRKLFFRRHYPVAAVTYCGMDPDGRKWKRETETGALMEARVFGFVARKSGGHSDNACHLFAEVDPEQPASAIVNFVTKIMIGQSGKVKP
ncbi:uncharacterized protein LOC110452090 isoform X5 [Mizuhopecten yessoensis]|uniref:uncharacterized protein LOC110452090 isoform X5 n=1 Tax=Mizuhopecten yessoensis TaxID=6573 RepID=UPI000B4583D3|nr:uncharacterized protein LOC110452090 isoform X5 [Mizuhopecten yessoensis]